MSEEREFEIWLKAAGHQIDGMYSGTLSDMMGAWQAGRVPLLERVRELEGAVRFYAIMEEYTDEIVIKTVVKQDRGAKARAALAKQHNADTAERGIA